MARFARATLVAVAFGALVVGGDVTAAAQRTAPATARPIVVASKPFGESYLLAELFARRLEAIGRTVVRRPGLGATEVAFAALRTGAIDLYPEYVGTGLVAILGDSVTAAMRDDPRVAFDHVARRTRARFGAHWLAPLGFRNGYAIAVRRETATRLALRTLSDLATRGAGLRGGFTADFIGRPDGWPGLRTAYGMTLAEVRPLAPAIKYQALAQGAVDVIDGYATDGLLARYDLVVLDDDRRVFPPYDAAPLASAALVRDDPAAVGAIAALAGRLTEVRLRAWNRRIEVDGVPVATVAQEALVAIDLADAAAPSRGGDDAAATRTTLGAWLRSNGAEIGARLIEHVRLVAIALGAAVLVGLPLGLVLADRPRRAAATLQLLGVLQTVPSLALLAFLIPLLGIGIVPALLALWGYALLPIVRATVAGLQVADRDALHAVEALGTPARRILLEVRLPLAAPIVMSGVRTAAVLTIGTATHAAFIGAGGLGEPIVTGLALADTRRILAGAIPAAVLAIVVDALLALAERAVTPRRAR
ncbi:MAG: ABC transporter permease subunit [Gemmatimonadaceae bacterium]|nr:ABC transporter permease subunit [Gemmatimonadaceae bacterium]